MKKIYIIAAALLCAVCSASAQTVQDVTLRLDYIFSGTDKTASIALSGMSRTEGWYGRRVNMEDVPVRGNGEIVMTDVASGKVLYHNSFSTLFQEWQATEEATRMSKAFENVFLVPMPGRKANVTVRLFDFRGKEAASMTHVVDPGDILIRKTPVSDVPCVKLHEGGDPRKCIDVVIMAEGYTEGEMDSFLAKARASVEALFSHEPFSSMKSRFNITAVCCPSGQSGVSVPREGVWSDTAVDSHFDTFYTERYLTTRAVRKMHDILSGLPYEHVIILANTDTYGGGGIYNSYTLTTTGHKLFAPVVVHEFGHSFGALADEYFYDDQFTQYYYPDVEPWEQNITTLHDFPSKWEDMIAEGTPRPTPAGNGGVGLYEGGGYQSKGVYRPCFDCRMRTNEAEGFCPVCQRAIRRIIDFNTVESVNGAIFSKVYASVCGHASDSMPKLVLRIAEQFLGTPYVGGACEGSPETLKVFLDKTDCITFVEMCCCFALTVKGLSLEGGLHKALPSYSLLESNIRQMRYRGGKIDGYSSRVHYTSEWILQNEAAGVMDEYSSYYGVPLIQNFSFMSANSSLYPALKDNPSEVGRIRKMEADLNSRCSSVAYIPQRDLMRDEVIRNIQPGDIVFFRSPREGLDITHVAFAYENGGQMCFLDASSIAGKVVVESRTLASYAKNGIRVARLNEKL